MMLLVVFCIKLLQEKKMPSPLGKHRLITKSLGSERTVVVTRLHKKDENFSEYDITFCEKQ